MLKNKKMTGLLKIIYVLCSVLAVKKYLILTNSLIRMKHRKYITYIVTSVEKK
jgi:hypothetical protein